METEKTIPILVGVTGHRDIRPKDRAALYGAVQEELEKLRKKYPNSPLKLLCSMAMGADLLCAEVALKLGIPLVAVLPLPLEDYLEDFKALEPGTEAEAEKEKKKLLEYCGLAEKVMVAPSTETEPPTGGNRNFRYRQAGIYIAEHIHVLLALWDGEPDSGAACGTAAAVGFSLEGDYWPTDGVSLRSEINTGVIRIFTPRKNSAEEGAGTVRRLGEHWPDVERILEETDEYNRMTETCKKAGWPILPQHEAVDEVLERMQEVAMTSDVLSVHYAKRCRALMGFLAAAATLLTLFFLLYDTLELLRMILGCGLMLVFSWLCLVYAKRTDCHRRFIEYRALAESLRVSVCLRFAGSRLRTAELLCWSQQVETDWVMLALCALDLGEPPPETHDILECWVEDQRKYHEKKAKTRGRTNEISDLVVKTALCLSVAFYLMGLVFELLWGGLLSTPPLQMKNPELCRVVLKIVMGTMSAATLFISNFCGSLSLNRTVSDHKKMAKFYRKIAAQLREKGQTETLLRVLAREELAENGNWFSYQSDNTPDISL